MALRIKLALRKIISLIFVSLPVKGKLISELSMNTDVEELYMGLFMAVMVECTDHGFS